MKHLLSLIFFIAFWSCNSDVANKQETSISKDSAIQVSRRPLDLAETDSFDNLIRKIPEIRDVPSHYIRFNKNWDVDSTFIFCGDSIYWEIVRNGKRIVPNLINQVLDSSKSNIKIQCSNELLNNGTIAFMILDQIIAVPYAITFNTQWCTFTQNCNYGYPDFLLEMINKDPIRAHDDLVNWYRKYENKFKISKILNKSECQAHYGINSKWDCDY